MDGKRIGICYDTKEDYGFEKDNLLFTDFVSLQIVSDIQSALEDNGYDVVFCGHLTRLIDFVEREEQAIDLVFNIAEGHKSRNRVALVPAYLEAKKIKHTGSDAFAMTLLQNKHFTKILLRNIGIDVPKGFVFKELNLHTTLEANDIGYPLIIKPNSEGGSMGIKLVKNKDEFISASQDLINEYNCELLCEKYIAGKEITVPIIGNGDESIALGVAAIVKEDGSDIDLYDAYMKHYCKAKSTFEFECDESVVERIKQTSLLIHSYFDIHDYSRMDFRLDSNGNFYFLEANLLPFLSRYGSFEVCAKNMNKSYNEIINWIVDCAFKRYK